jgi:hypothetical protein
MLVSVECCDRWGGHPDGGEGVPAWSPIERDAITALMGTVRDVRRNCVRNIFDGQGLGRDGLRGGVEFVSLPCVFELRASYVFYII